MTQNKVSMMGGRLHTAMFAEPEQIQAAVEAIRDDLVQQGVVNRNSDHLNLLASVYRLAGSGIGQEYAVLKDALLELSVTLCMQVDTSVKRLTTRLELMRRFGECESREKVQDALKAHIDPLARLLHDTAAKAPIFGPSLEDMLLHMNALTAQRDAFIDAHGSGFECVLFDDKFLASMLLNTCSIDAERLTTEMLIPTTSSAAYPFGWTYVPGFKTHPVVKELGILCAYLERVSVDPAFREVAMTNLLGCVVNWCGEKTLSDVPKSVSTPRSNGACNGVIFDMLFSPERLEGAFSLCREKGGKVLTEYIFNHHRSLASKLPRQARAHHLEEALGL